MTAPSSQRMLTLDDFDYHLPEELIAQHPEAERRASRLLHVQPHALHDLMFPAVLDLLQPNDCLVVNDTRVIKARLFGKKASGGAVEILLDRLIDANHAYAMVRASKSPQPGSFIDIAGHAVEVLGRDPEQGDQYHLRFGSEILPLLDTHGSVPLPPYISHEADGDDERRYQTVYADANKPGAVAAPTAGLHFDDALLTALQAKGVKLVKVTLHVGAGTFAPVRVTNIAEHKMHSEWFSVPQDAVDAILEAKARGGRCVAVGTTSMRSLESAAAFSGSGGSLRAATGDTSIFITPGFRFSAVDALITNFHLPKSTLMMLISAFAGMERVRTAYAHAVAQRYRFFSYGDAMFLEKKLNDSEI
ncbi:S-adenosylmethionine:tRNA ribosyltransferase-isomerase [beta proteobacterium AAP99]|nr:S-adenosylmethionine:tRNA ribosyltransferase-isomerase [beta proteobacterium AAP99]